MPWPYRKNFCNQPHSRTAIFLIKGVIEFRAGKSVIFIIPTQSKWTEAYKKYVAPLVAVLAHRDAPASGQVFEAGGGWVAQVRWTRAPGVFFDLDRGFGAEDLAARWGEVTDFSAAVDPEAQHSIGGSPQLQQIMKSKL